MAHHSVEHIELKQDFITQTSEAFLIETDFRKKKWIPKSICTFFEVLQPEHDSGFTTEIAHFKIPYWIAKKEGLI